MLHLSQSQLIRIWSELEQAYYGDNRYGSDTAEIYAYTVMEHSPIFAHDGFDERKQEYYKQAAQTLYKVLTLFETMRGCRIYVNGLRLGDWLCRDTFEHRVHVRVLVGCTQAVGVKQ